MLKKIDKLEMIPYEDTGYGLGFLLTDHLTPNVSRIEQYIEQQKKKVFKILTGMAQAKGIADILVIYRKSKVLIWREYINTDFGGQM